MALYGWPTKKILSFRWSKKAKITLEATCFWQNISICILKFSSIFIYNGSLPMKSYQIFKISKRFDKEREKTLMQQSMRKERLRKVGLCFITGCFMKSFNMIINNFFFASSFTVQFLLFDIRMTQEISKGEVGNDK